MVLNTPTGKSYRITKQIDFEYILAVDENNTEKVLLISELSLTQEQSSTAASDLFDIDDELWAEAKRRKELINPMIDGTLKGRKEIDAYAKEMNVGTVTLYRWYKAFTATNSISSLIPMQRGWVKGISRLNPQVDEIIMQTINDYYLSKQRLTQKKVVEQVRIVCHQKGIEAPAEKFYPQANE